MQILKELCLEIINSCPMRCIHCSNNNDLQNMLNFSEIKSVIDDFINLDGKILEISGGEPLEHPDLLNIIYYAKIKGLKIKLYTSGLKSEGEEIVSITHGLAKKLKISGLDKIIFNIQGASSHTHEHMTDLKGSYDKVKKSIKQMASVECSIEAHFVPTKVNFREMDTIIKILSDLGVSEFSILRFVPQGRGLKNKEKLELSIQENRDLLCILAKLKKYKKIKIRIGHPLNCFLEKNSENSVCLAGKSTCLIKPNGEVVPCPAFKQNMDYVVGNIKDKSLFNIWLNSETLKIFRTFNYEKINGCMDCISLSKCQGGCTAQRILAWGDYYTGNDPACMKNAFNKLSNFGTVKYSTKELFPCSIVVQE